jgi:predicted phosphodiesterase
MQKLRPLALILVGLALAVGGVLLGMRVAGDHVYDTDFGHVRMEVEPAFSGEVDAYIPIADWGLRADAFTAPVALRAEARSVNRRAALRAAGGDPEAIERTREQLDDVAAAALLREGAFALGGALAAALLVALVAAAGHRPRRVMLGAAGAVFAAGAVLVVVSIVLVRGTFDAEAFERPRFYAHGAELIQLLDAAAHSDEQAERYQNKVEGTLIRLSDLLATSGAGREAFDLSEPGRRALLASDLHGNGLVVRPLERLARPARPIFFVGDFGHQGSEGEVRALAPRLRRLGSRVVAVSGNHDSTALMRRLAGVGVTVLTSEGRVSADGSVGGPPVISVAGLQTAGYSDPLEWRGATPDIPERIFSFTELPDGDARLEAAKADLVRWFDGLPERPDVVLVHQNSLAQHLAATLAQRPGHPSLVVLTGHDHLQHVDRHGNVVVVDAGSVGAGGVLGIGDERVALGDLHFDTDSSALRSVDLIDVDPFEGGAQAQRVVVEGNACDEGATSCELSP